MSTQAVTTSKEAEILARLELPMTPDVAQSIVNARFSPQDVDRMQELLEKGNKGTITPDEQQEADSYERVGHLLGMLQSTARRTLRQSTGD